MLPSAKALGHQQIKALAKNSHLARVFHGTSSTGALGSQYHLLVTNPPGLWSSFSHDHPAGGEQGSAALAGTHLRLGADSVIGVQSMTLIFPWGFPQREARWLGKSAGCQQPHIPWSREEGKEQMAPLSSQLLFIYDRSEAALTDADSK